MGSELLKANTVSHCVLVDVVRIYNIYRSMHNVPEE